MSDAIYSRIAASALVAILCAMVLLHSRKSAAAGPADAQSTIPHSIATSALAAILE